MYAHLSTERKPRSKKLAFHYESYMRKSKFLEQSGGVGGGGWVCRAIKVMRTRVYPLRDICRGYNFTDYTLSLMLVLIYYMWGTSAPIILLWTCCLNIFDKILSCTAIPKKQHTISTELLPNDSEA